jgi:hypothetical protein
VTKLLLISPTLTELDASPLDIHFENEVVSLANTGSFVNGLSEKVIFNSKLQVCGRYDKVIEDLLT